MIGQSAIAIAILTAAAGVGPLLHAQTVQASVPFVGCKSDGQIGPIDAPKGSRVVAIRAKEAEKLAYYKSGVTIGVLAPRDWHCAATYGSGGDTLYVVPEPIDPGDVLASEAKIGGSAVVVQRSYGETSGRFTVAAIIARIFPAYNAFVRKVTEMFDEESFPSGPYPADIMRYEGQRMAEYRTPPRAQGLGTYLGLAENDGPIFGAAALVGKSPDLLLMGVRLPATMDALRPVIVAQFEHDVASQNAPFPN